VQAAQIDLETAQAAFKYRYNVLTPAQVPKKPVKPNVLLVMLVALVAAAMAAIVVAAVADVRAGRLLERWQIVEILGRPVLGEMVLPGLRLPARETE
jgi:capsular polysaccharide biosynthesis protein